MTTNVLIFGSRPARMWGFKSDREYHEFSQLFEEVLREHTNPDTHFIIPAGQGAVTCALKAIDRLREKTFPDWTYDLYIPYPSFADRWPRGGIFGQNDFDEVKASAECIITTEADPTDDSSLNRALRHRNEQAVQAADCVILISPIPPAKANGGTGAVYRIARSAGKPILWVDLNGFEAQL